MKVNETPSLPRNTGSPYDEHLQQALIGWMRPVARAVNSLIDGGGGGGGGGGGSAHVIEDESVPLAQRATLNFVGTGVTVTDTGTKTLVTIAGGVAHVIQDEGASLAQRGVLDFAGSGVTVTDTGGRTLVTIPGGGGGGSSYFPSGW